MALDDRGWFQTLEFPRITALLVQKEKETKYVTKLKELPNGNCIVLYRGRNQTEKEEIKEANKLLRAQEKRIKDIGFHKKSS